MINQLVPNGHRVAAVHVWEYLAADRRARAIRLMAQLAFNLVLAQSASLVEEPCYAKSTHHPQNSA